MRDEEGSYHPEVYYLTERNIDLNNGTQTQVEQGQMGRKLVA